MDGNAEAAIRDLAGSGSIDEVTAHAQRFAQSLGYPYFMLALAPSAATTKRRELVLTNYPDPWLKHYGQSGYFKIDPLLRARLQSIEAVWWDAVDRSDAAVRRFFDEAAHYGLVQGVTQPVYGPNGECHAMSLSGAEVPLLREERERHASWVWQFAAKAIPTLRRFTKPDKLTSLTERQREALALMSQGLMLKQIADRMSIDKRTVTYLLKRSVEKLGVRNREQAIVRALTTGQIQPLPYLPSSFEYLNGEFGASKKG